MGFFCGTTCGSIAELVDFATTGLTVFDFPAITAGSVALDDDEAVGTCISNPVVTVGEWAIDSDSAVST